MTTSLPLKHVTSLRRFIALAQICQTEQYLATSFLSDRALYKDGSTAHFNQWRLTMQSVIGIDVSKKKLDVCAIFDGKTSQEDC